MVLGFILVFAMCSASLASHARDVSMATSPCSRPEVEWWGPRHGQKLEEIARRKDINVVFLGDSITHFWEKDRHLPNWRKWTSDPALKVLNLGFSGDRTENVIWRIQNGEMDGYSAKVVVLMIGTNNAGQLKESDEPASNVVAGVKTILDLIRERQPQATVVLCAILPRSRGKDLVKNVPQRNQEANARLREFCDGKNVVWCDFGKEYLLADGKVNSELMPDFLHPSDAGYDIFGAAVFPVIGRLLGLKSSASVRGTDRLTLPLWPEGQVPDCQPHQNGPFVEVMLPERRQTDALILIAPGGSYEKWGTREAASSKWFLDRGMATAVLHYRVPRPKGLPKHQSAWQDAQRAVRIVRSHAKEWAINPERIGFLGFSAGGNLAIRVAVSSETPAYRAIDALDESSCNVNWAVACYPAYLLSDCKDYDGHNAQQGNPLDLELDPTLAFDAKTPPMCLLHGDKDGYSPMGSVRVYHRLRSIGVPAELHVFANRTHAFGGSKRKDVPAAHWKDRVWEWLRELEIVP